MPELTDEETADLLRQMHDMCHGKTGQTVHSDTALKTVDRAIALTLYGLEDIQSRSKRPSRTPQRD